MFNTRLTDKQVQFHHEGSSRSPCQNKTQTNRNVYAENSCIQTGGGETGSVTSTRQVNNVQQSYKYFKFVESYFHEDGLCEPRLCSGPPVRQMTAAHWDLSQYA